MMDGLELMAGGIPIVASYSCNGVQPVTCTYIGGTVNIAICADSVLDDVPLAVIIDSLAISEIYVEILSTPNGYCFEILSHTMSTVYQSDIMPIEELKYAINQAAVECYPYSDYAEDFIKLCTERGANKGGKL